MSKAQGRRKLAPPWARDYDERIYHRGFGHGPSNLMLGLVALAFILAFTYLALAKTAKLFPFDPAGLAVSAVFEDASTLAANSPVRIAGVNVGRVTSVEPHGDASVVNFEVYPEGQPIGEDATVAIRPRLFLEGNFFLDVTPGSPSSPHISSGDTLPASHTTTAVQLDEVLTALQSPDRQNLQLLLEGFGTALTYQPTAEDDLTQDPDVQGQTAAEALNDSFLYGGPAGRDTAIVSEALLGREPHDLSDLIASLRVVSTVLADREAQLQELIVNFDVTLGAFAAEATNLSATIRELAPTLEEAKPALVALNGVFPPLRASALALEPSLRELPATIAAGFPWLNQAGALVQDDELGGIAALLRTAAPGLGQAGNASPRLFGELTLASRCTSQVLVPTGDVIIGDGGGTYPITSGQPNWRELFYTLVGFSGESQGFDGNGSMVRFQPGGGPTLVEMPNPGGGLQDTKLFAHTIEPPQGTRPLLPNTLPPKRTDVDCYRNAVPNLNAAPVGTPLPQAVIP